MTLYTIGYEGRELDAFIFRLKLYHVSRVIDVRDIPVSHNREFSQEELRERLTAEKIEYVHVSRLRGICQHLAHGVNCIMSYERSSLAGRRDLLIRKLQGLFRDQIQVQNL